ncbi:MULTISPECIES: hypothetical protein [unclassified Streptomyces]|uniref:hypothetical protein n=1 Tax=unclassified Streptomyces TaxID=2593676 RepID=UPI002ED19815|nr:hypothetical protein OH827_03385 [Streptomyces sp. NBC_00891]WSY04127.1 hypothetical protein OG464_03385 [Streptomyces sp. NBC_00890]WSZ05753.1 hypothetical protein OG704_03385 [Streptomyces sp. NBC_00869]WSZ26751.1 hypothetical protein OG498_30180 [Streptomyces sp. NBC_00870]
MNEHLGAERLTVHTAVLGKYPGRTMGYEVLRSSLPDGRANTYLWRAAATGEPGGHDDPDGALPWRVFLGAAEAAPYPGCAHVEVSWDGSSDGTGAPSYTWQLTLLDCTVTRRAALTWSGIDSARLETPQSDDAPTTLTVPGTSPDELAAIIDDLGFSWVSGVAALLLDGRQVALVPGPGRPLPDGAERVRVLDAVCALLPYACRSWLSGATWTGGAEHELRLFFAPAARAGQTAAVFGGSPPQPPRDAAADDYLRDLRRLRAKTPDTATLVAHLLTATEPAAAAPDPPAALGVLRDADLLDLVVEEVRSGAGRPADVSRVLDRHPAESLDDAQLAALTVYLARQVGLGSTDAGTLLAEHWSERVCSLLARDVLSERTPALSVERAEEYLGVVHKAVEERRAGSFDALFHALVDITPEPTEGWAGSLIHMAENWWGRSTHRADRLLVHEEAVGKTWLGHLLSDKERSLGPLERLVNLARTEMPADATPGWLRFGAVLLGASPAGATATDAIDFAEPYADGWLTTLEIARLHRRPEVLGLMWPRLWRVARTESRMQRDLGDAVGRLVPVDVPAPGAVAADADLFNAAIGTGGPGMPRLERLADETELRTYAAALLDRISSDSELRRRALGALVEGTPGPRRWWVTEQLTRGRPDIFSYEVCEWLHRRLNGQARPLNHRDVPDYLMELVERQYNMEWLRSVRAFRQTAQSPTPHEALARVLLAEAPDGRLPARLSDEVAAWTVEQGSYGLEQVALWMDALAAQGQPGLFMYRALVQGGQHERLREQLARHSRIRREWHARVLAYLGPAPDVPQAVMARDVDERRDERRDERQRRGLFGRRRDR